MYYNAIYRKTSSNFSLPEVFFFYADYLNTHISMKVIINNKEQETSAATLQELAEEMKLPEKGVAIAVANKMVPRSEWASTPLHEGDNIVIIKAACGG